MHLIESNVTQGFIEVTVNGFWDEAHFDRFVADLRTAIATFPPGATPMTLYNYTHAAIQTQAVVARMRALAQSPALIDRRVAMYTEGVLARQQAKRVAEGRDNMRVFDSRAAALDFLLGGCPEASHRTDISRKIAALPKSITQIKADPVYLLKQG